MNEILNKRPAASVALVGGNRPIDPERVVTDLRTGAAELLQAPTAALLDAWSGLHAELSNAESPLRRRLDPLLMERHRLSRPSLHAALGTVLEGVRPALAQHLFERARVAQEPRVAVAILPSNVPGIGLQCLLPALAKRSALLLKPPSSEPSFTVAVVEALADKDSCLAQAYAALAWEGGNRQWEEPLFGAADRVVAYGGAALEADLSQRSAAARIVVQGPRWSLAIVDPLPRGLELERLASQLATDIVLFEQRGCLSIHAILTSDPLALAPALVASLERLAHELPPPAPTLAEAAALQQVRLEAAMRGLWCETLAAAGEGMVLIEAAGRRVEPSPGMRTVRLYPLEEAAPRELIDSLGGRIQGVALEGERAWSLTGTLSRLGATRFAAPGQLQRAPIDWPNGGLDPLSLY